MTITGVPQRAELVGRAADLIDLIRGHALWQEEHRVMHEETLRAVLDAGLLKMRVPVRYGGFESNVRTVCEVIAELGRADGSVGWTVATWMLGSWAVGLFPDEVQDEIFADPEARICVSASPKGVAVPTEGGVILNGEWDFNSGAPLSQWEAHSALLATEDGGYVPAVIAVPMTDMTVIDNWHTAGLRATSSVTVLARDLFVPQVRVLPLLPYLTEGRHLSERNAESPTWQVPFVPHGNAVASSPALGMAQAAQELFLERLPGRKIIFTNYDRQIEAPITHLQVAEAAVKIDEAAFHLYRAADRVDTKALVGQAWSVEERVLTRMDAAAVCLRAKEAVDILNTASGGSSIYSDVPIQRVERDVRAINLNGVLHPNTAAETYGRVLCGMEPNTILL